MYHCPECKKELHSTYSDNMWDHVNTKFKCQNCKTLLTIYTDCSYDPESGDEELWFIVERTYLTKN